MFNLRIAELENNHPALMLAASGKTVYVTGTGKFKTTPGADRAKLLNPFSLADYGYHWQKFTPEQDPEGFGGWGYERNGELVIFGDSRADAWEATLDHAEAFGHIREIETKMRERWEMLVEISPALWDADGGDHGEYLDSMGIDPQQVLNA